MKYELERPRYCQYCQLSAKEVMSLLHVHTFISTTRRIKPV